MREKEQTPLLSDWAADASRNASSEPGVVAPTQLHSVPALPEMPPVRFALLAQSLWALIKFDVAAKSGGFGAVHERIDRCPVAETKPTGRTIDDVCAAVNRACEYYPRNVACLQRSAAIVSLLRRFGFPADLVIGVSKLPFKSHAWVEVQGRIVTDSPRIKETYAVIAYV